MDKLACNNPNIFQLRQKPTHLLLLPNEQYSSEGGRMVLAGRAKAFGYSIPF
jgi:hypothetical protein